MVFGVALIIFHVDAVLGKAGHNYSSSNLTVFNLTQC